MLLSIIQHSHTFDGDECLLLIRVRWNIYFRETFPSAALVAKQKLQRRRRRKKLTSKQKVRLNCFSMAKLCSIPIPVFRLPCAMIYTVCDEEKWNYIEFAHNFWIQKQKRRENSLHSPCIPHFLVMFTPQPLNRSRPADIWPHILLGSPPHLPRSISNSIDFHCIHISLR